MVGRMLDRHAIAAAVFLGPDGQPTPAAAKWFDQLARDNYVNGGGWHENDREHAPRRPPRTRTRNSPLGETGRRAAWRSHQDGKGSEMTDATGAIDACGAGAAAVTDDGGAAAAAASQQPEWMGSLPDELKGDATLSRYADIPALAKAHIEAHKVAKSKVIVPGPDADEAALASFYDAIGRPESPTNMKSRCRNSRSMRRRKRGTRSTPNISRSASWRTRSA
jgi:hypothetical protein